MYADGIVTPNSTYKIKTKVVDEHRLRYGCCYGKQRAGTLSGRPASKNSKTQIRKRREGKSTYNIKKHPG